MKKPIRNKDMDATDYVNHKMTIGGSIDAPQGYTNKFRIKDEGTIIGTCKTLKEVYETIKDKEIARKGYWHIEDLEDDVWIHSDELINAWEQGERPEDLQGF